MTHPDERSEPRIDVREGALPEGALPEGVVTARNCTASQLRRFIRSRPYVPLHELRRRFELNGEADDVSTIDTPDGPVFVGLPERESRLLQELVRQHDVGLELCKDPMLPVVVGIFPMRPVLRT
jgi:hypothetical protein